MSGNYQKKSRAAVLLGVLLLSTLLCIVGGKVLAQGAGQPHGEIGEPPTTEPHKTGGSGAGHESSPEEGGAHKAGSHEGGAHGSDHKEGGHGDDHKSEGKGSAFDPHAGSWVNPIARLLFYGGEYKPPTTHNGEKHYYNIKYDYIVISFILMGLIAFIGIRVASKVKIKPEGKPHSLVNAVEAALEGFQGYVASIMGPELAQKYTPLIASFFFTILIFNYAGLVPGLIAPTSNPNVPFALGICAFFCVHIIAIKEAGFKSWFMHLVGEPVWMAPLAFPLHLIGELVKPASLGLRLLGNVFGEEVVIAQIALLAVGLMGSLYGFPIPLQLPILMLSVFFGLLQAMVFSTLLAIYIGIFLTHHDDHDSHNAHGHTEHVQAHGHDTIVARPTEVPIA